MSLPLRATRYAEWSCTRCLHEFDTDDPALFDSDGSVFTFPTCPRCGYATAVQEGGLWDEPATCGGCEKRYDHEAVLAGTWDTSDMESPVCPDCLAAWRARGGGYFRCTGCGTRLLSPQPFEDRRHQRRVQVNGSKSTLARIGTEPCGEWVEDSLSLGAPSADAKSVGGAPPLKAALSLAPLALASETRTALVAVLIAWAACVALLLWAGRSRNGGPLA